MSLTRYIYFLLFLFPCASLYSQSIVKTEDILPPAEYDNVHVHKVSEDSLSSTFVIFVKEKVALHKHEHHSENVYVLEGTANMMVGEVWQDIKPGDLIFIPKNTWHEVIVTSKIPLKVISIQSPLFDGTDRVIYKKQ